MIKEIEGSGMARSGNGPYKGWMKGMIGDGGQMESWEDWVGARCNVPLPAFAESRQLQLAGLHLAGF